MRKVKTYGELMGWKTKKFNSEADQDSWIRFHLRHFKINILCPRKGYEVEYREWMEEEQQELRERTGNNNGNNNFF